MIFFFQNKSGNIIAVQSVAKLASDDIAKFEWLLGEASLVESNEITGWFVGPRCDLISPWSDNVVEIAANMNIRDLTRIEYFVPVLFDKGTDLLAYYDPMLQGIYENLTTEIFTLTRQREPIQWIDDIAAYNQQEGLALSDDEIAYLEEVQKKRERRLTDSEIFGFSQVNSEHCRHKIFNGQFIIDGEAKPSTLFRMIKQTSAKNPNHIVSAYQDNCAFIDGPVAERFSPARGDQPAYFSVSSKETVISLKAETHNFPTTVEPFNGGATGGGGEIRDRVAGGKGANPSAGTTVYMTSYPRLRELTMDNGQWTMEDQDSQFSILNSQLMPPRPWIYQSPLDILMKASNGASDYGNKHGQPLICGSLLTFEHLEKTQKYGFDKVIMMAGGIGNGNKSDSTKGIPEPGDKIILLGGPNYRIGMGGGAGSSVATGEYDNALELNAVQRSNPVVQKRVVNAIRAMVESEVNPIVSIHDHGAGGHLNCISELVEATGGKVDMSCLPVGDPTLSAKEIVGNESQERMGLILKEKDVDTLRRAAERERAPMYVIGEATGDKRLVFENPLTGEKPIDLMIEDLIGNTPKTVINDQTVVMEYEPLIYEKNNIREYVESVLQLEAVACKDWLTNKVDRSVTGLIAMQQTAGEIQLPLNNLGVVASDYHGQHGTATSIGHAPGIALLDAAAGSRIAIAEALTNIVWAHLKGGLKAVSLSANWQWPCKNPGEDARLYSAVEAAGQFAIELGINIPTGKDSLSMTQKYPDGDKVLSPGAVIISTVAQTGDVRKTVSPVLDNVSASQIIYIDLSCTPYGLGGSSFAQILGKMGDAVPDITDSAYFAKAFETVQQLIGLEMILSGHDVSAGGLITTLLEMCFANCHGGMEVDLTEIAKQNCQWSIVNCQLDIVRVLFAENPALILQVRESESAIIHKIFDRAGIKAFTIGKPVTERMVNIALNGEIFNFDINSLRKLWFKTSYLFDCYQSGKEKASERFDNYSHQYLHYNFPAHFKGDFARYGIEPHRTSPTGIRAAIIREQGALCDRETAWIMYLAGMDVKDVHTSDLIEGRETLDDVNMIVFAGSFSGTGEFGSARGWAGSILYNEKAKATLDRFYARPDTLSLGICNGCLLMLELGLITPDDEPKPGISHNDSKKMECAFVNVTIPENKSVMLHSLSGSRLGIWTSHGEGKFNLTKPLEQYNIALQYSYNAYPGNPNGSPQGIAAICSDDGRHLAMMPHPERGAYPWNWPHYPASRINDQITPWIEAFVNAVKWIANNVS
ncbi:MAG: phosphoribosylformylglycinamidine synthase [Tannerella sp.]|jgi:phosphoribosylformylglycinamidine synthase|nr:phosphoribosylformylglycinamidine synthase [Tannerella sp.]